MQNLVPCVGELPFPRGSVADCEWATDVGQFLKIASKQPDLWHSAKMPALMKKHWIGIASSALALVVGFGVGAASAPSEDDIEHRETIAKDEMAAVERRSDLLDSKQEKIDQGLLDLAEIHKDVVAREDAVATAESKIEEHAIGGDGQYVVGEDVKAGTYKTSGPAVDDSCYYAVTASPGRPDDIVNNANIRGPGVVVFRNGQVFESDGCSDWIRK